MTATAVHVTERALGAYALLEKIGSGAMGSVYKGRHRATQDVVAIKVATQQVAANPVLTSRFEQEYQAARKLNHPHLIRGLDYGLEDGVPYLVMEFVDGKNLEQLIKEAGRLAEAEAVRLILQVADALHTMHQHKIVHRDIKPENILVTSDGNAKLTDLGLIKNIETDLDLTRSRIGLGTPPYMAPEQFGDAKHVDARCDVYSLGATLYKAVSGEAPFGKGGNMTILGRKLRDELRPPSHLVPNLSIRADLAIRMALRADPGLRQGSCLEFLKLLTGKKAFPVSAHAAPPAMHNVCSAAP